MPQSQPVFLELWRIRLPLPGVVSILHRISGVLMVLALPVGAWLLGQAVSGETAFQATVAVLHHPLTGLILLILLWSFLHHLFTGVRYLVMDLGYAVDLPAARRSARWALIGALVATIITGLIRLGAMG